jgi:hypothetical protein
LPDGEIVSAVISSSWPRKNSCWCGSSTFEITTSRPMKQTTVSGSVGWNCTDAACCPVYPIMCSSSSGSSFDMVAEGEERCCAALRLQRRAALRSTRLNRSRSQRETGVADLMHELKQLIDRLQRRRGCAERAHPGSAPRGGPDEPLQGDQGARRWHVRHGVQGREPRVRRDRRDQADEEEV